MALVQAKCCNCGALLKADTQLTSSHCQGCGAKYNVQEAIQYYNLNKSNSNVSMGSSQTDSSFIANSVNKAVESAEAFVRKGDYSSAKFKYTDAASFAPQDYRVWWGLIVCTTENFTTYTNCMNDCEKWIKSVEMYAPASVKSKLLDTWKKYNSKVNVKYTEDANLKARLNEIGSRTDQIRRRRGALENQLSKIDHPEFLTDWGVIITGCGAFIFGLIWLIIACFLDASLLIPIILMAPVTIYSIWFIYKKISCDLLEKKIKNEIICLNYKEKDLSKEADRIRETMENNYNEFVKRRDESIRNCLN